MHDQIESPAKSEEGEENHEESSESEVKQESEKEATPAPMIHQEEEEEPTNIPEPEPDPLPPQTASSVKEEVVQMDLGEDSQVEEPKIFFKEVRIRKHDKNREAPKAPL